MHFKNFCYFENPLAYIVIVQQFLDSKERGEIGEALYRTVTVLAILTNAGGLKVPLVIRLAVGDD